jgi:hypothetical protein
MINRRIALRFIASASAIGTSSLVLAKEKRHLNGQAATLGCAVSPKFLDSRPTPAGRGSNSTSVHTPALALARAFFYAGTRSLRSGAFRI